jgi:O-succinylbenzoic acid--CoA ligase
MHHTDPPALFLAVGRALDGGAPFVIGRPAGRIPEGAALVLPTSGSTGSPRYVALSAAAVLASGAATADRLGGPGHWVLALPADHVAGVQVLARAHAAGLGLTAAEPAAPFTARPVLAGTSRSSPPSSTACSWRPTTASGRGSTRCADSTPCSWEEPRSLTP